MDLSACDRLTLLPLNGHWYRALRLKYWDTRLSTDHSRIEEGRFGGATESAPLRRILYLGANHVVAMFEARAVYGNPADPVSNAIGSWLILRLHVVLDHVADLSDPAQQQIIGSNHQELTGDWASFPGAAPTQSLGESLEAVPNLEGFLYASARFPGKNLVVFPDKLGPRSSILFENELTGEAERLN